MGQHILTGHFANSIANNKIINDFVLQLKYNNYINIICIL